METNTCPTCHAPIPANAPGGFCPACLLRDADEPPTLGHSAPTLEEIAAAFPQLEVIELIGQGGMGFVYKVRQPSLDRIVALKILAPELGRDPAFAERFAREARTLGKLHHPNIVMIFEHGEKDGYFYLLMEYVDGVNLRQAMRAGRFTPEQALAIVPGICDALQVAHAQGIWHRDIKPENILLDREGRVKIADFGIARIIGDPQRDFTLTRTGNALGSVSYMAPEQHEKPHQVDHRADIYSLGVVIYEMLTGELPFGRFPAPSQRTSVDARIDEIVFKTLEKERELRHQSATEVKTDVQRVMTGGAYGKLSAAAQSAPQGRSLGKLAFWVFLVGIVIPFPLWIISERAAEAGFILSTLMMVIALVCGLFGFREKQGKIAVFCSMLTFLFYGAMILFMSRGPGPVHPQEEQVEVGKADAPTAPSPPAATTIPVEEVFRKAFAAANESDHTEFSKHMGKRWSLYELDILPNGMPSEWTYKHLEPIEMMELFTGELVQLKVADSAERRDGIDAFATIRRRDGLLSNLIVEFENRQDQWIGTNARRPNFRAISRIEFQPPKGDAEKILLSHLGFDEDHSRRFIRTVDGKPGQFDVIDFAPDAQSAKDSSDMRIQKLRESLKKFGLDAALSVVSPADVPEAPYMAEDAPSFQSTKP